MTPFSLLVIISLLLFIQVYFYLYYFLKINSHKIIEFKSDYNSVSIIVCAHNELENLRVLIPSLLEQNYHKFEVIIVNDRSTDGSWYYLEDVKKTNPKIKVVHVEETKSEMDYKKYALTLGIKAASNEFLLFTDADCLPVQKNWILSMQSCFDDKTDFVLGISQYTKKATFLNFFIQFETLYTAIQYISFAIRKQPFMGIGRNISYRKSVFLENKGFQPYMYVTGGDDDLFVNRLANKENTVVNFSIDSQTISYPKETWKEYFAQKRRHLSVGKYYNFASKFKIFLLNFSHIFFYCFFVISLFFDDIIMFSMTLLSLRLIIVLVIIASCAKKFRYQISILKAIIFDLLYPIVYIWVGTIALFTKKVRWK